MKKFVVASISLFLFAPVGFAQSEGIVGTQALVEIVGNASVVPAMADVHISVDGKKESLSGWSKVPPKGVQMAILLDDGLKMSVGRELAELKTFVAGLPPGTQIFIGYMHNGSVSTEQRFTTDLASASQHFRLPIASPGISASPYLCVSEFVKHWPADPSQPGAKFILMITNGVDPYNGNTNIGNQSSPYVDAAAADAERAGVIVSSVYYGDAGFHDDRGSSSGQSYLSEIAEDTGGHSFYEGTGNPVSLAPFLAEFQHSIAESFVATFPAKGKGKDLVRIKVEAKLSGAKLRTPQSVRPGNAEMAVSN